MSKLSYIIYLLLLVYMPFGATLSCRDFQMVVGQLANCRGSIKNMIKLENFKFTLNDQCILEVKGCVQFESFKTAHIKMFLAKDLIKLSHKFDVCQDSIICSLIPPGKICFGDSTAFNLTQYEKIFGLLLGRTHVMINVDHGSGKSCIVVDFKFKAKQLDIV